MSRPVATYIHQMQPWIDEEEKRAVAEYLDGGGWLTEFQKTREFERMIGGYVGSTYASVVSNGTVSLIAALLALGVGEGAEVIVPDYTMIATANAVGLVGASPVLVDVDRTNLCLNVEQVEAALTTRTRAIMLVSVNGRSPDMEAFVEFAGARGLWLIEDAAQSLGSRYKGKHLGTFGDIGSFSFSAPKVITTGQGGALVTDRQDLFEKIRLIRDFGRPRSGVDYHEIIGFNFKFTDLQAVIGIEQMKKLDFRVNRKKEIYVWYRELLTGVDEVEFIETNLADTSPWFIDILVREQREDLMAHLHDRGVGSRPFYPAIHTQPPYAGTSGTFPNAEEASQRGLWLPSSSFLERSDVEYICGQIRSFFSTPRIH